MIGKINVQSQAPVSYKNFFQDNELHFLLDVPVLSQVEVDVRLEGERGGVVAQVDLEAGKTGVWLLGLGWL